MGNRCSQVNKRNRLDEVTAVKMAVNAVTGGSDILDLPMAAFDPAPTSLDLPDIEQVCSRRRPVNRCPKCGSPLCKDCVARGEY